MTTPRSTVVTFRVTPAAKPAVRRAAKWAGFTEAARRRSAVLRLDTRTKGA